MTYKNKIMLFNPYGRHRQWLGLYTPIFLFLLIWCTYNTIQYTRCIIMKLNIFFVYQHTAYIDSVRLYTAHRNRYGFLQSIKKQVNWITSITAHLSPIFYKHRMNSKKNHTKILLFLHWILILIFSSIDSGWLSFLLK